jgi:hypothetical protein
MCDLEDTSLQKGMLFRRGSTSVLLMSVRPGAPYADSVADEGRVLIYEGHDEARRRGGPDPKMVDQPEATPRGRPTQNGLFFEAAKQCNRGHDPIRVRVYEKLKKGLWVFNGTFLLRDAWREAVGARNVFKFRLEINDSVSDGLNSAENAELDHTRLIPSSVKVAVWERDRGKCVRCNRSDNLHFDHVIPFSKGGSSLVIENIQLLCARHNLRKRDRIE